MVTHKQISKKERKDKAGRGLMSAGKAQLCLSPDASPLKCCARLFRFGVDSPSRESASKGQKRKCAEAGAPMVNVDLTNDSPDECIPLSAADARQVPLPERGTGRKSGKALRFPSFQDRMAAKGPALQSLRLTLEPTNGFQNNCLWFSANMAAGKICSSDQYGYTCQQMSKVGRARIQEELMRVWPASCDSEVGIAGAWWEGHSRCSINDIFESHDVMKEPHIYALANLMEVSIAVMRCLTCAALH